MISCGRLVSLLELLFISQLKYLLTTAPSPNFHLTAHSAHLYIPFLGLPPYDGADSPFHVCRRYQRHESMARRLAVGAQHDWFLEFNNRLAESKLIKTNFLSPNLNNYFATATSTMAVFQVMGALRWD
jgi:hypothetical protein